MSGHFILWWRDCISNRITSCCNYASGFNLLYAIEEQRQRVTSNTTTVNVRERTGKEYYPETRRRLAGSVTSYTSYLPNPDPNNEGQHINNPGEHQGDSSDGRHHGFRYSVTGDDPSEVTQEVTSSTEYGLSKARKVRQTLEKARADKLRWLIEERDRLHGN